MKNRKNLKKILITRKKKIFLSLFSPLISTWNDSLQDDLIKENYSIHNKNQKLKLGIKNTKYNQELKLGIRIKNLNQELELGITIKNQNEELALEIRIRI